TVAADHGAKYRCVVTSSSATAAVTAISTEATLTVTLDATSSQIPKITTQPQNQSVTAPAPATFAVAATSPDSGTLTYQWQKEADGNWANIANATAASYTTLATTVATDHGAKYRCVVTNTKDAGKPASATTNAATLTVLAQQSIALDTTTGRLKVDYAGYLSRHDVVYKSPVEEGVNGATVGTGRMGGMVWNKDGLKLEVTNVDAAPYSCIPSGLITYQSSPMPKAVPGKFEQRLNLHKGSVTTEYGDGLKFTIMGDPDSELMGIHVVDTRTEVTEAHVDLSLWLDKLNAEPNAPFGGRPGGNPSIVFPNEETWLNPKFTVRDNYVAITRGGEDPNNFGYTIALTVEGATYNAQLVGAGTDKKLRLNVDPADKEYTIWIANPSRRHAANHDTLTAAETMLSTERTYEEVYGRFTSYWDGFWNRCFAEYQSDTNSDADYLENSWYLYQYLIGCGSRGEFPFHFMNGVWRGEEQDEGLWSWDYTSFNERTFSYTHYATNRLELTNSYYNLFYNNLESGKQYTIDRFWKNDKDPRFNPQREGYIPGGVLSPERHTWNGEMQVGYVGTEEGCPYTTKINATAAEHAMGMYERYAYTGDLEYLKTKAYPFIKAVGIYLLNFLQYDSATDTYYSENSHALEQYWGVTNPITDMASFPALLERAIAASELLGVDADLRAMWQDRLTKLAKPKTEAASEKATAISGGANRYQPHDPPRTQQMNSQNPELDVVWPYSRVGLYQESAEGFDFATALNSYIDRKMPINIWTPEPIVSARLGLGDESFQYAVNMIARSQTKPNGIHYDGNGSLESNALILTAVGEELLQSYNDKIAVFPAVMSDPTFRSKFTLLARGGFLVSSEYEQGAVKYVSLVSQLGGKATVINPWGKGEAVTVRNLATNEVLLDSVTTLELTFDTVKDGKYVVEQDSRSLSAFLQAEAITAPRNEAPKYLSKSGRILGSKPMDSGVPITEKDVIVNENDGAFRWTGAWTEAPAGDRFGGNFRWSGAVGNSVDISFAGQGILLYSTRRADGADYEIYLDGVYQGTGSVKGGTQPKHLIFSAFGLTDGEHVVTIRHSAGSILEVDAAKVPSANPGCVTVLSLAGAGDATVITAKGGTLQLTATVDPAESPLKWTVTDLTGKATAAAEISASGLLTAKTNGVVRVTAAATDASLKSASIVIAISGQIEAPKVIASAASVADVSAAAGTAFSALTLPKTVGVTLVGGGTAELPVLWQPGNYDPAISATYALIGTLLYGADYENPDGVTARVNVVLGAQAPAIRSVSPVELTAGAGTSFQTLPLPATVTATLEGGATVQVSVIWDASTYDSAYVGKQHLTGTLQPNEAYTNPEKLYATAVLTTTQRSPEEVKLESKLAQARAYLPAAAKYQPDGSERLNEAISTATAAMQSGEALEQAYSQLRDAIFGLREIP
ncbi:MAG: Ig-like domain-containing protein, partial [Oscillospiraceae bacterium]